MDDIYHIKYYNNRCTIVIIVFHRLKQCPKLSFGFVHSQGALPLKLCTQKLLHAPSQYIAIINSSKKRAHTCAHLQKSCTRPWKYTHRVQGAPLISDTGHDIYFVMKYFVFWI